MLILEDLNRKLDLLLEMQDATLKMMEGWREELRKRPKSSEAGVGVTIAKGR